MVSITRRAVLCSGAGATLGCFPFSARADMDRCDLWEGILARIRAERTRLSVGGISVAPGAVESAGRRIESLRGALREADEDVGDARRVQLIELANATGSSLFLIAGLVAGGAAVPIVFAGAVLYGSGIIVVRGLVAPESVDGVKVARSVAVERLEGVLGATGSGQYVVSQSVRDFTKIGGVLVTTGTLAFDWIEFVRSTEDVRRGTSIRRALEKSLAEAEKSLEVLKDHARAEEMRSGCLEALEQDVQVLEAGRCSSVLPVP